ncbi:hypothetical protein [Chitinimonas naiadis]
MLCSSCGRTNYVPAAEVTPRYGKLILAEAEMPQAMLDRFNAFKPSRPNPNESALINSATAETLDWYGHAVGVDAADGPYTVVITLYATAKAAGPATSMWQAGWELENGQSRRSLVPGLSKADAKAGEKLIITAASQPLRFNSDQQARPVLALVNARNIEINAMRVVVVAGVAASSWRDWFWVLRGLLVVGVMFVLWWFWFRVKPTGMT